jgi:transaldolase/glucose-6-phosphate isomerase
MGADEYLLDDLERWPAVSETLERITNSRMVERIWSRDPSVWKEEPKHQTIISNALGWLTVVESMEDRVDDLKAFADSIRQDGFQHALLLGMGGSSLCPEVLRRTFGRSNGFPELLVLDSTVPAAVLSTERQIDPSKTLFIVASKSGAKIEPQVFLKYFFDKASRALGRSAGQNFIAITDAGSPLEREAGVREFRRVFLNSAEIGGRYSALSYFGLVPASIAGYDIETLLHRASEAARSCRLTDYRSNPALLLGAALGALWTMGRDKLTLIIPPPLASLGLWIEQLIAESTGKESRGILPVATESLGSPSVYGKDRIFAVIATRNSIAAQMEATLGEVGASGHPVIRCRLADEFDLSGEFFRWEFATAVLGAVMGINPFDQPNVEESLTNTARQLDRYRQHGALPEQALLAEQDGIRLYSNDNALSNPALREAAKTFTAPGEIATILTAYLKTLQFSDYVAITAFLEETEATSILLERLSSEIRNAKHVATTIGYGPRFLHSTGQLHKGGPARGLIVQITADDSVDVSIPGEPYTFGVIALAQALGDFESLGSRGQRVLRVHLGGEISGGLSTLCEVVQKVLSETSNDH